MAKKDPRNEAPQRVLSCDVFVYGSTPGGVAASVEAARRGQQVVLACPKAHPGGMSASGLCTTDAVRRQMFGPFVQDFIARIRERYLISLGENHPDWPLCRDGWFYEPSVAEAVFREIIEPQDCLEWLPGYGLTSAFVANSRIAHVQVRKPGQEPVQIRAKTFIDATYEGDLAAEANVPFRVGREGREEYGEPLAGIHYMNWKTGEEIKTALSGQPSIAIQAYCARSILTNDPDHRIPINKPESYDQHLQDILPLIQDFESGRVKGFGDIFAGAKMPNQKREINGNIRALTSTNCPGISWGYPEADRKVREHLDTFHIDHVASLLWFVQHDPHVPNAICQEAKSYGLHDQEFCDNGHWPWQIYVRQGRRIQGRAIVTQHNFTVDQETGSTPGVEGAIALGEYSFDVHPCHDRRFAVRGCMEGVLSYPRKAEGPAQPGQVPYGAMLPRQLDNLLVPVALSSTHIAMSVLRMEPLWMTTGQVAGLAACVANKQGVDVAHIDPAPLPGMLGIHTDPKPWIHTPRE